MQTQTACESCGAPLDQPCPGCSGESQAASVKYLGKFVNVYLVDRAFGGSEEGGWWYDTSEFIRGTEAIDLSNPFAGPAWPESIETVDQVKEREQAWCDDENKHRRSDIGSVLSEGKYVVEVEDQPGHDTPIERPYYE